MPFNPAGIWCQTDVVAISMRRNYVALKLIRRHVPAGKTVRNKTCHRDRKARLTAPCPSHKKTLMLDFFANAAAAANADAGGSIVAFPGLRPDELKIQYKKF